jgi:hypothetical protein
MDYEIKFDRDNSNGIIIKQNNKLVTEIACPSIEKGCDVIDFNKSLIQGYNFDFDGLILITTSTDRKIYYKGDLIDTINK